MGDPDEAGDEVVLLRGAVQDITERKTRERELQRVRDRMEFALTATDAVVRDWNAETNRASFYPSAEPLYGTPIESWEELIEFAVDGADRMREMIGGLLAYSRIETEGDPFDPVDLNGVLEDVQTDLKFQIEDHGAEITVGDLPTVEGDASQLHQLFQNSLENAIEYSGDDPPRVEISATRTGDEWVLSVRDEGIGIAPEHQNRIFEVFQRLHTRDEHAGTGIGLALVKRIVERHDGEIRVDSEPGEGTTFSVSLPSLADGSTIPLIGPVTSHCTVDRATVLRSTVNRCTRPYEGFSTGFAKSSLTKPERVAMDCRFVPTGAGVPRPVLNS